MDFSKNLHQIFKQQAAATPDVPAVVDPKVTYTYGQLDQMTDALAGYLQKHGVRFDTPVGIFMETSAEYVLPYLGALKAGGAYMPLDLAYPESLLRKILLEAEPAVVVTKAAYAERLDFDHNAKVLVIDADPDWMINDYDPASVADQTPDHLAFVAYSSGTTGDPKGILDPHRGAIHSYFRRYEISDYQVGDRVACNIFFVWEILRPLLRGATCHVIPDEVIYDPARLVDFLAENEITEVLMTPSLLETVLNAVDGVELREKLSRLRVLWLNGEVVTVNLKNRAIATLHERTRLLNTYSISECHDVSSLDLKRMGKIDSEFCPVGFANEGVIAKLFDDSLKPAKGDTGELLIGGPCLARGYLKKPELTAERFVTIDGERFYRTGDMARVLPDGRIEILGRCDDMVKIRGYSINLGAVQSAMQEIDGIRSCAVLSEGAEGTDKRLVAYVVPEVGADWGIAPRTGVSPGLRRALADKLPDYSIPSIFVSMQAIPLNPVTGKLNRKALPQTPERAAPPNSTDTPLPTLPQEATPDRRRAVMLDIWHRMLGLAEGSMDVDSNFFDFGGHSLLSVKLTVAIEEVFGKKLAAKNIYEYPTVRELTAFIEDPQKATVRRSLPLKRDATLDPGIAPGAEIAARDLSDARSVLITGATGFLGAFLLRELIDGTPDTVTVYGLVRPKDGQSPVDRIRENLKYYGLWDDKAGARVKGVPGDLTEARLGITEKAWDRLSEELNMIFHCASLVNYVYPYDVIKPHTVDGTREILRLACERRTKPLYYISSNGIFPNDPDAVFPEDDRIDDFSDKLTSGYCQAKWVAEKLVWEAVRRGLPASVFRPGNIGHHSDTGAANPHDFQVMLINACATTGVAPEAENWLFELTPVDFLTRAIVDMARESNGNFNKAYNIVAKERVPADDVFQRMREKGIVRDTVPLDNWVDNLAAHATETRDPALKLMAESLDEIEPFLTDTAQYESRRFEKAVAEQGLNPPRVNTGYFDKLLSNLSAAA